MDTTAPTSPLPSAISAVFNPILERKRQEIRRIYDETLKPFLSYDNMQVAISRPNNLRDLLSRASLHTPNDTTINDFIAQHYNTT